MIRQPRRGLQDIRTRTNGGSAASESSSAHGVYLKMAMLEIERERRGKEQVSAAARANRLGARMRQIDDEVRSLRASVDDPSPPVPAAAPAPAEAADNPTLPPLRARLFRF